MDSSKRTVRVLVAGGLIAAVGALIFAWQSRSPLPRRFVEVRPGWLFRSAQIPAADVATVLRDQGIDLVVDLTADSVDPDRQAEAAAARALGVSYVHSPVTPGADEITAYAPAIVAIAQAHARGDRVLVHCELGHRRSAATIALYARLIEHEPPAVAYRELFRFADEHTTWQAKSQSFLEQHLPELEARVTAALAQGTAPISRSSPITAQGEELANSPARSTATQSR